MAGIPEAGSIYSPESGFDCSAIQQRCPSVRDRSSVPLYNGEGLMYNIRCIV